MNLRKYPRKYYYFFFPPGFPPFFFCTSGLFFSCSARRAASSAACASSLKSSASSSFALYASRIPKILLRASSKDACPKINIHAPCAISTYVCIYVCLSLSRVCVGHEALSYHHYQKYVCFCLSFYLSIFLSLSLSLHMYMYTQKPLIIMALEGVHVF